MIQEEKIVKKAIFCILVCTMLIGIVSPVSGGRADFNVTVDIDPNKHIFSHLFLEGHIMVFTCRVFNEGPEESTQGTVTFEIKRIFSNDTGLAHYEEWIFGPRPSKTGCGQSYSYGCYNPRGIIPSVYLARLTIDIDDNNPLDNSRSFLFFVFSN
jgi:hypothetical protein